MVNLVLVSNTCSDETFKCLSSMKNKEKLAPSQKYFDMLVHGLADIDGYTVTCLTARAIDPSNCNLKGLKYYEETVEGIKYIYPKVINKKIIKNLNNFFQGKKISKRIIKENKKKNIKTIFLLDPLSYDISVGALKSAKNSKKCCVITDLPEQMYAIGKGNGKRGFIKKIASRISDKIIEKADCFGFITESMNVVNTENKPYAIIEGMVMPRMVGDDQPRVKNIVMYAGGLFEKFGIKKLIEAFLLLPENNYELHLYGEGLLSDYITTVGKTHPNVKYMGAVGLNEIMSAEKEAKLLVNPRPSNEDFTKYSFPSKTLEYMSAGRPVLTTKLSGIPEEYFDYVYTMDDESVEGIKKSLAKVLSLGDDELNRKGLKAKEFVFNNKSNVIQSGKLCRMLKE